jgi:hypothetical protein
MASIAKFVARLKRSGIASNILREREWEIFASAICRAAIGARSQNLSLHP